MSLADSVKQQFSAAVRKKGDAYFKSGRVGFDEVCDESVFGAVMGSNGYEYEVDLDWSDLDNGLSMECACPHYADGNYCKHLWATLLEVDASGIATLASASRSLRVTHDKAEDEYFYDEDEEDDEQDEWGGEEQPPLISPKLLQILKRQRSQRSLSNQSLSAPTAPDESQARGWHSQLSALPTPRTTRNRPAETCARRLLYVLDVTATYIAGAPCVLLYEQRTKNNGEWGKAKTLRLRRDQLNDFEQEDREILGLALGNHTGSSWTIGNDYPLSASHYDDTAQFELMPDFHELLLPKLCATGRFGWVLASDQPVEEAQSLAWDDSSAWQLRVDIQANDKLKSWTIRGELVRNLGKQSQERLPLAEPVLVLTSDLVVFRDKLARFDGAVDERWMQLLRANDALEVPYDDRQRLLAELWATPHPPEIALPENLKPQFKGVEPRGYLKISAAEKQAYRPNYKPRDLHGELGFEYQGQQLRVMDSRHVIAVEDDQLVERRYELEDALLKEAHDCGVSGYANPYDNSGRENVSIPRIRFLDIVRDLTSRGWHVEAEGAQVRSAGAFSMNVTSGVDWFDLESTIDFGEATASLPALLAAAQENTGYVKLSDGSQGLLPEEWLERFAPLAELAEVHDEKLRFKPSQALLLDALLSEREGELRVQLDQQFRTFRKKLSAFDGVKPKDPPRGFHGELREYQRDGLGWLNFLQEFQLGGCLADDMGLGKTVQVLALLQSRRTRRLKQDETRRPSLVVAPKSVAGNWIAEAVRFAPRLVVLDYTGQERHELRNQFDDADLIVTTYGTLRRDIESLGDYEFDYAILDESQAIKNDKSQSAKASRLLRATHRLALTGTPIENHFGELWSQFEFLNPGMLGRSSAFRTFARGTNADDESRRKSLSALKRSVSPFLLRRTKENVLQDLPEKQEQSLHCELLSADRKRYNDLRNHYRDALLSRIDDEGMNKSKMHVLEALLRLRQAACHPGLIDKKLAKKKSAKLELLLEQLIEVIEGGHKALVFSQFTSMLAIVRDRLDNQKIAYEYLDGKTRKRQECVDRFQTDDACSTFLISLKAGGTGLNLTAADYVFLLDPWWNPAVEAQAIDRAHRIGQERRVFAYRLIAKDTIEEKIIELQQQKRELADVLIDSNESLLQQMTAEDLQLLLS